MKKEILKIMGIGAISGLAIALTLSSLAFAFSAWLAIVFEGISIIDILQNLLYYIFNYCIIFILPFTIICTATSMLIAIILLAMPYRKGKNFVFICTTLCFFVSATIYYLTINLILEPDEPTRNYLNLTIRTLPSVLFVVWGYLFSRHIYRSRNQISHG